MPRLGPALSEIERNDFRYRIASRPAAADTRPEPRQPVAAGGNSAPVPEAVSSAGAERVADAARDLSQFIQTVNRSLQISVDSELGSTIITVVDSETDEVIRQIPQEELVEIARFIAQQRAEMSAEESPVRGLFMDSES